MADDRVEIKAYPYGQAPDRIVAGNADRVEVLQQVVVLQLVGVLGARDAVVVPAGHAISVNWRIPALLVSLFALALLNVDLRLHSGLIAGRQVLRTTFGDYVRACLRS